MNALVDIGVNLTHRRFAADLPEVLRRAREVGVRRMMVTGLSVPVSRRAEALARTRPAELWCTAGIHPHNARTFDEAAIPALRRLAESDRVVAVGECGLDYDRDFSPRDVQRRCFEAQLELAAEVGLPVFLHEREATQDFLRVFERHRPGLVGGVVHCFTGGREALRAYLELGLHIGITGYLCDERRGRHLKRLVREIPPERLMIETDAPFLTPRTLRPRPSGGRNEPAFLPHVLSAVAEATGRPAAMVAAETSAAADRLFGWRDSPPSPVPGL